MNIAVRAIAACVAASLALGCGASPGRPGAAPGAPAGAAESRGAKPVTIAEVRTLAMNAADSYATAIEQACDQIRLSTTQPVVADWAWQTKITTSLSSFTNASGPGDGECLLDMILFATLKRHAMEEHWIPTVLHEEGKAALEIYRRAEADVWATAGRALTREQLDELRGLIDRWRQEHPGQYYVVHLRFASLAEDLGLDPRSPKGKLPGSIFGLLHVDPLAGLDPVTAEMRNYRAMSERMMYMAVRMPRVVGWQVEYAALRATGTPEIRQMIETADRFAAVSEKLPAELSKERQAALVQVGELVRAEREAAVDQVNGRVAGQREAIVEEVARQGSQVRQIIADVSGLVANAEKAAQNVNDSTSKTIVTTEEASRRTMKLGFWLALPLLALVIFGTPGALLLYRIAVKRWAGPTVVTT